MPGQSIPVIRKHSIVVPVATCSNPKALNYFRPIVLASLVMKVFEKVMKRVIQVQMQRSLDPMKFAYRVGGGVEDATLMLLNSPYHHLECPMSHARLLFIDFFPLLLIVYSHICLPRNFTTKGE